MPTTSEGFYYPDSSTSLSLVTILAAMAASSDAAHKTVPSVYDTIAARNTAIPSPTEGRIVYTKDYDILWYYSGSAWRPVGVPTFASTAARDAAITSPVAGMRCFVGSGSAMAEYIHDGTTWRLWGQRNTVVPLTASFTGSVRWAVGGGICTVYASLVAASALSWTAWSDLAATTASLPAPASPYANGFGSPMGIVQSNQTDTPSWQAGVTAAGVLLITARWGPRTCASGGWLASTFSYPIA